MAETLHGWFQSEGVKNQCGNCHGHYWLVSETPDGRMWWLCSHCGHRAPLNPNQLDGEFPKGMKLFESLPSS